MRIFGRRLVVGHVNLNEAVGIKIDAEAALDLGVLEIRAQRLGIRQHAPTLFVIGRLHTLR